MNKYQLKKFNEAKLNAVDAVIVEPILLEKCGNFVKSFFN